jgi:methyltransferase (TIGR00027 family)
MRPGEASRSALGSAWFRAAHLVEDPPPWILEDFLAAKLLSPAEQTAIEETLAEWSPAVRTAFRVSHVLRARVAEDEAIDGLERGRRHYVILGAGLDTFAWRHPRAAEMEVLEIDHPDTQAWKRFALDRARLGEPAHVDFLPVDLSQSSLAEIVTPPVATWNWLGVTMYLDKAATEATLRAIAVGGAGTTVVVNFLLGEDELDDHGRAMRRTSTETVAAGGEPWIASYSRPEVGALLTGAGFGSVELLDAATLAGRYLSGRTDLRVPATTIIAVAAV